MRKTIVTIKRVFIIGLDGGTYTLLDPQMTAGNMPALQELLGRGVRGDLRSTIPPITAAAWRSFATGCNPGKHGIVDFIHLDQRANRVRVQRSTDAMVPLFWDEVGNTGRRVGLVAVPMTYPPRPVNGFCLTGLMTPPGSDHFAYPPQLAEELRQQGLAYPTSEGQDANPTNLPTYVEAMSRDVAQRVSAAVHLLEQYQPALFAFVFGAPDPLQHQYFAALDPDAPLTEARAEQQAHLARFYRAIDDGIARLLSLADDETLILIMSDHGFGRMEGFIHLNNWLLQAGYLKLRRDPLTRLRALGHRLGYTPELGYLVAKALGLDLRRRMNRGRVYDLTRHLFLSFRNVDWIRTRAYALGHIGQLYVNLAGRQPLGVVQPGAEYDALCRELSEGLLKLKHSGTGQPLVARVHRRDELYSGPFTDQMPDLLVEPVEFRYVAFGEAEFASSRVVGPNLGHTGHHRLEGILGLSGPNVRTGETVTGASIMDIAPTVLYALGLPVPRWMDGSVLADAFDAAFVKQQPVTYTDRPPTISTPEAEGYSNEEEELVRQRLRDLGYTA